MIDRRTGHKALKALVETINKTGGVVYAAGGVLDGCAGLPQSFDLAAAYMLACQALGTTPTEQRPTINALMRVTV